MAHAIAKAFVYSVVGVKRQNGRLNVFDLVFIHINRIGNDDFVATLARAGCRAIQDAAARTALAIYDISTDARAGILVPDVDEFHRQDARRLAVIGIQGNGSVIIQVCAGDTYAVEFAANNFSHWYSLSRGRGRVL